MYKACSRCGKIHDYNKQCYKGIIYQGGEERKLRATYQWAKKSLEIRDKANYLCEVCRDQGVYTYNDLEVHHIEKLREQPTLLLDNFNLVCLCKEHHMKADNGEIDKEYLKRLAKDREEK